MCSATAPRRTAYARGAHGRRVLAVSALASLCAAAAPAAAAASTVKVVAEPPNRGPWANIEYRAAAGEINRLVLVTVDEETILVSDSGAVISPGHGCRAVNSHKVRCSTARIPGRLGLIGSNVRVGDRNDVVDTRGPGMTADGGPGDDTLQSSSVVPATLDGGGGRDTLLGGRNADTMIDGDVSGAADHDILDGREGGGTVSYAGRTSRVKVDLADSGPDGEPGEGDIIRSVDSVTGGAGNDELRGDDNQNRLHGGPGRDRLAGFAQDDFLDGGRGRDRLDGDDGGDWLLGRSGSDRVTGGAGDDYLIGGAGQDHLRAGTGHDDLTSGAAFCGDGVDIVRPSSNDYVDRDCERLEFALPTRVADSKSVEPDPYPYHQDSSSITLRVRCPYSDVDGIADPVALTGTVRITTPRGRALGSGRIPRAGRRCATASGEYGGELPLVPIRVRLNATGRRVLSRPPETLVTIAFSGRNVPPVPWTIGL